MIDLQNSVTSSFLGGIIGIFIYFINNKIKKKNIENIEYLKLFILIFTIVYFILYITKNDILIRNKSVIHTGNPKF